MFTYTEQVERGTFRGLVFALLGSWIYDIFWLILLASDMAGRQRYDGDLEMSVRKFSVIMTWCSVFFRVRIVDFSYFAR